jgi:malonyl-CoA O-methyltransferase
MTLDIGRVRHAFSRAASGYEALALLQREVEARLLERLELVLTPPGRVLDVGAGPGRATAAMRRRFPQAEVIALDMALPMLRVAKARAGWWKPFRRVCGDARALPIADQSVDLIFSSLCLQWCEDLNPVFAEFRRVLRPGGWLFFSTFGPDTLTELRQSWAAVDDDAARQCLHRHARRRRPPACRRFPRSDARRRALTTLALLRPEDPDARTQGHRCRQRGSAERARGLTGKRKILATLLAAYEALPRPTMAVYRASYEVVYAQALAPDASQPRRRGGTDIAAVSIDSLRAQFESAASGKLTDSARSPSHAHADRFHADLAATRGRIP